jgi:raffinose/stachyose/melibiose transport system permease protein
MQQYHSKTGSNHFSLGIFFILKWIFLAFFFLYTLLPLVWLLIASFKTNAEFIANPFSLPGTWQFRNYIRAVKISGIMYLYGNSALVSVAATAINLCIASMISYSLSRFKFRGREFIFTLFATGILVPLYALMVPYFKLINFLKLYDTYRGLVLVYTAIGLPVSIFIIRTFMATIPKDIEEAAVIDGCSFYQRFAFVIIPLSKIGIITAGTFQFITCWNEYVYAMLLTSSPRVRTVQLGIKFFTNQFSVDYVSMFAAIVLSIIPSVLAYILFQKQIVSGLTGGAVKG